MSIDYLIRLIAKNKTVYRICGRLGDVILPKSPRVCSILEGPARNLKLKLSPRDQSEFLFGTYERGIVDFLLNRTSIDNVFWDIGAHIGYYSCIFARRLTDGQVVAVEPLEDNIELLKEHIRINHLRNVLVVDKALSSSERRDSLVVPDTFVARIASKTDNLEAKKINISVTTLDALVESGLPTPDIIKMDVEGEEAKVLKGGEMVFQKYRPCMAIAIHNLEAAGECWDTLRRYKYNIQLLEGGVLQKAERPLDISGKFIWAESVK